MVKFLMEAEYRNARVRESERQTMSSAEVATIEASKAFGKIVHHCASMLSGEGADSRTEGATTLFARKVDLPKTTIQEVMNGKAYQQDPAVLEKITMGVTPTISKRLQHLVEQMRFQIASELSGSDAATQLISS